MRLNVWCKQIHRVEPILVKDYVRLVEAEESFLRRESRLQWLNLGDKNSKFFFNYVKGYHNHNKITFRSFWGVLVLKWFLILLCFLGLSLEDYLALEVWSSIILLSMKKFRWSYSLLRIIRLMIRMILL